MRQAERYLTDGNIFVPLANSRGIAVSDDGNSQFVLDASAISNESGFITRRMTLNTRGMDIREIARQHGDLIYLVRKAWQYKHTSWQAVPVYLIERAHEERFERFAIVIGATELSYPDALTFSEVLVSGLSLQMEFPWQEGTPAELPSAAITLVKTDGGANTSHCGIANFRENNIDLTHIYVYDNGVGFSGNYVADPDFPVFPAVPAAGDIIYFGSTVGYPKHVVVPIGTAGSFVISIEIGYCKGGGAPALVALVDGTSMTRFPTGVAADIFKSVGDWWINSNPPADAALATINGVSAYWVYVKCVAVTSCATVPVTNALCYLHSTPHIEIPGTAIGGDAIPVMLNRLKSPYGGAAVPSLGTISRIIMGAKSRGLDHFVSHLNAGNVGNPAEWAVTYGADSSSVANLRAAGGFHCAVSFATSSIMANRAIFLGTGMTNYWKGRYRVSLRVQQIGGANGDIRVRLLIMIGGITAGYPAMTKSIVPLATHDAGWELIDLIPDYNDFLNIPFAEAEEADNLSNDFALIVQAERLTGAATLQINDIVTIPIDEWFCELRDPLTDPSSGGSALRGNTSLDLDGGIIADRTIKYLGPIASVFYPAETWNRAGEPLKVQPGVKTRVYYLMAHYPSVFGTGPLVGSLGMMLDSSVYKRNRWNYVRSD